MAAAKRWCFTLNNYTESDLKRIKESLTEDEVTYAVVGKETGKQGTKHLQGFVNFKRKVRLNQVNMFVTGRAHLEKAKGSDIQNKNYCTKEGDIILNVGTATNTTEKGGGNSMKIARVTAQKMAEGSTIEETANDDEMWISYVKHSKVSKKQTEIKTKAKEEMSSIRFKQWQSRLINKLNETPHQREVMWYYDPIGHTGKTYISKYLTLFQGSIRLENGKSADIKYAYQGERIVIFDLCRSQMDHFNYEALESMKNGLIFSPKYESKTKFFDIPHVLVFANWLPDESKLSNDRWNVTTLNQVEDMQWEERITDPNPNPEVSTSDVDPNPNPDDDQSIHFTCSQDMWDSIAEFLYKYDDEDDFK